MESQSFDRARFVQLNVRARRLSALTTGCLLLLGILVVGVGMLCGTYLYRQYVQAPVHRFRGWCSIPYNNDLRQDALISNSEVEDLDKIEADRREFDKLLNNYFQEEFELDLDTDKYEKIDVPDFKDGRSGRFIHDFNTNLTSIVDTSGGRCFVMPLDRSKVLAPRSLFDLVNKIWGGYYNVDTEVVRETMRVVTPPISDRAEVGQYISQECNNLPIYKLEKYVGGGEYSWIFLYSGVQILNGNKESVTTQINFFV